MKALIKTKMDKIKGFFSEKLKGLKAIVKAKSLKFKGHVKSYALVCLSLGMILFAIIWYFFFRNTGIVNTGGWIWLLWVAISLIVFFLILLFFTGVFKKSGKKSPDLGRDKVKSRKFLRISKKVGITLLWPAVALGVLLAVWLGGHRIISWIMELPLWLGLTLFFAALVLGLALILKIKRVFAGLSSWVLNKGERLGPDSFWFKIKSLIKWLVIPLIPTLFIVHHYSGSMFPGVTLMKEIGREGIIILLLRKYFLVYLFWAMAWAIFLRMKREAGDYKYFILYPLWLVGVWLVLNFTPLLPKNVSLESPDRGNVFQLIEPDQVLLTRYNSLKDRPVKEFTGLFASSKKGRIDLGIEVENGDIIVIWAKGSIRRGRNDYIGEDVRAGRYQNKKVREKLKDPDAHPFSPTVALKPNKYRPIGAFTGSPGNPESKEGSLFFLRVISREGGKIFLFPCNMPRKSAYYGTKEDGFSSTLAVKVYHLKGG